MTLEVIRPGLLTTVQDLGRRSHQHEGVPEGGAMDSYAARLANLLLGNDEGAAVLEITLTGPLLRFAHPARVAITGASFDAQLDGEPMAPWRAVRADAGSMLDVRSAHGGCRGYLAIEGGIDVPLVLGSRSTYLPAVFGGLEGRALRAGDRLSSGSALAAGLQGEGHGAGRAVAASLRPSYGTGLRLIAGEDCPRAGSSEYALLFEHEYRVSDRSDRMGYRLEGASIEAPVAAERLSAPVTMGTLQLPPGGSAILLMADRQTTGGYPVLGQVATVDLGSAAQLRPGQMIRFTEVSTEEAQRLYLERERWLVALRRALALSP